MKTSRVNVTFAVASFAVFAMIVAGCSSSGSHPAASAQKKTTTTSTPATAPAAIPAGQVQVIVGSATGSSPCEKAAPTPSSPGQVGAGAGGSGKVDVIVAEHSTRGMVVQQTLTHAQRVELEAQIKQARGAAATYSTVASALAAGYDESTPYVPCIGAHYTNQRLAIGFNPSAPSELLYDGTEPDSKIVGLSYLVFHPNGPPPGFSGTNDHWHQHNANGGLCLKGGFVVGAEATSPQECADLGGQKTPLVDIWMLHAWVVPGFECTWGVFSGECPELGGRLAGTAWEAPVPSKAASSAAAAG